MAANIGTLTFGEKAYQVLDILAVSNFSRQLKYLFVEVKPIPLWRTCHEFMRVKSPSSHSIIHPKYNPAAVITHFLNTSKTINHLRQTHALLLKLLNKPHYYHYLLGHLLSRVLRFPTNNFYYALHVFHQLPNCKNEFLWTSLIRASVFRDLFGYSIYLYVKMHQAGVPPSVFTFSSVLNACSRIPAIFEGKQVHSRVVQSGLFGNKVIQTAILDLYAKCGCINDARDVFDRMFDRDIIAWTAMIRGYTKLGMMVDAKLLFDGMEERNSVSWTTLIAGYANMGDMKAARELFDVMHEKNAVTRVAMIAGYGKCGDVRNARRVFNEITEPDASSCVAMVACCAQNGYPKEAINMYKKMREANLKINEVATVAAVSACAQLRDIEMSKKLTDNMEEGSCDRTLILSNALIHMHMRCGNMHLAWREFDRMSNRDVVTYSTMISGLAEHGRSLEAIELFSEMQKEGIRPNEVTFIGVLNACSFAGLIEQGCMFFKLMTEVFGLKPLKEHFACMVDLFGRAGQLEKAYNFIKYNIGSADATTWGTLLGACRIHGNVELAEIAGRHLFEMEPESSENYVLLANTYASKNKWDEAENVRKIMSEKGMRKSPGFSWI